MVCVCVCMYMHTYFFKVETRTLYVMIGNFVEISLMRKGNYNLTRLSRP